MQNKLEEIIASIDISGPVPEEGDQRQYYYIKKMRDYSGKITGARQETDRVYSDFWMPDEC